MSKLSTDELEAAILATVPAWIGPMDTDMVIGRLRRAGVIKRGTLRLWRYVFIALEALEVAGHIHRVENPRLNNPKFGGAPARGRWYMRGPAQSEVAS
jgi:hypothetical protein